MREVNGTFRYKDRGSIQYTLIEKETTKELILNYSDDEKEYTWEYVWKNNTLALSDFVEELTYEGLKEKMANSLNRGLYGHKGEYVLMKDAVIIFISHRNYVLGNCENCEC